MPTLDDLLVLMASGQRRSIWAYRGVDGVAPAKQFLDGLDATTRARYALRFNKMCIDGQLRGQDWHKWDGKKNKGAEKLGAFKDIASKTRIPCFPEGDPGVLVLTHGFGGKKENDIDPQEVNKAIKIREEYYHRKTRILEMRKAKSQRAGGRER